jgi:U3 small nucleolar RNA-associated protein 5
MLLSQIEIRASTSFAPPALGKAKQTTDGTKEVRQYLEGESDADDDEPMDAEPDVENADDGGSVEDVQLGNESEEDAESSSVDESEEDESADDDDDSGPQLNGFIDDEAEEYEDDESDDESE